MLRCPSDAVSTASAVRATPLSARGLPVPDSPARGRWPERKTKYHIGCGAKEFTFERFAPITDRRLALRDAVNQSIHIAMHNRTTVAPGLASFGLRFDHLGLAVSEPTRAIAFLEGLGYTIGPKVTDPLQNVNLILCCSDCMPDVELIFPSGTPGPLDRMLAGRTEMLYHLCFSADSEQYSLDAMRAAGHHVVNVSRQKPAVLFGGCPVSFFMVRGFGLIEIVQRTEATG